MSQVWEHNKQVKIKMSEAGKYHKSLIRLLDRIELDGSDKSLKEDLTNIYQLLQLLKFGEQSGG